MLDLEIVVLLNCLHADEDPVIAAEQQVIGFCDDLVIHSFQGQKLTFNEAVPMSSCMYGKYEAQARRRLVLQVPGCSPHEQLTYRKKDEANPE